MKNKHKHNRTFLIVIVMFFAITACSNPTDATKDNFEKAINEYYSKVENCIALSLFRKDKSGRKSFDIWSNFPLKFEMGLDVSLFEHLKDAGFLNRTKVNSHIVYNLTEKGKKYISTRAGRSVAYWSNPYSGKVCIGQRKVHEITGFTAPSNYKGHIVSFVKFTEAISFDDWAKDHLGKILKEAELFEGKSQEAEKKTLVLTSNGWIVDR